MLKQIWLFKNYMNCLALDIYTVQIINQMPLSCFCLNPLTALTMYERNIIVLRYNKRYQNVLFFFLV